MKNGIKTIVTSALLLASSSAFAGIFFLGAGGQYIAPNLALVSIENLTEQTVRIRTSGLNGELSFKGSDFPPKYEVPASATGKLPFAQELELVINLATGVVEGSSSGQILCNNEVLNLEGSSNGQALCSNEVLNDFRMDMQGKATCLPLNGRECGQLVVDLELRGVLTDPNDPSKVGQLQMVMLGSLVWDDTNVAHWAAISANTTIGARVDHEEEIDIHDLMWLISSVLETMGEGEVGV